MQTTLPNRTTRRLLPDQFQPLRKRILHWAAGFPYAQVLDNCGTTIDRYGEYELLVGVGLEHAAVDTWEKASSLLAQQWLMGAFPYDLKNIFEPGLKSNNKALFDLPEVALFQPATIVALKRGSHELEIIGPDLGLKKALRTPLPVSDLPERPDFVSNFSKEGYIKTIEQLREHIAAGDCYEINLSQVFHSYTHIPDPAWLFDQLVTVSPVPFGAMLKWKNHWLLCASPERFLQKKQQVLRTQPIKGTAARGRNLEEDQANIEYLKHSKKEQAENVMIVDLSRNDLYRVSETNSVHVPYLFEIQTFPTVHQLVSTVEGKAREDVSVTDIIEQIFPPGSMTGAPKVSTMKLIEQYEPQARGLYAGSVGYCSPEGDFDLNVVIRTLQYNSETERLEYQVGGAITYDSDPESEYEETLIKAEAIRRVFA
ncbi:MAG: aminodeoxychorismate synthase component I [Bacteroidia bacterium]